MRVKDIAGGGIKTLTENIGIENEVSSVYCCDLLSLVMGRAPSKCAWFTVMANVNIVAVAQLAGISCIVIAEGIKPDEITLQKACENEIPIFATDLPVFEAALQINNLL